VNRRQHAALARQLITASGGLNEALRQCRLKRSRLAECQDPNSGAYMPADVINQLELYCGQALYSRALADDRPTGSNVEDLADEACETAEEATDLQRLVRLMAKKGRLTPREQLTVLNDALKLRQSIDGLIAAADEGGS
jgi:hypothetical protein